MCRLEDTLVKNDIFCTARANNEFASIGKDPTRQWTENSWSAFFNDFFNQGFFPPFPITKAGKQVLFYPLTNWQPRDFSISVRNKASDEFSQKKTTDQGGGEEFNWKWCALCAQHKPCRSMDCWRCMDEIQCSHSLNKVLKVHNSLPAQNYRQHFN